MLTRLYRRPIYNVVGMIMTTAALVATALPPPAHPRAGANHGRDRVGDLCAGGARWLRAWARCPGQIASLLSRRTR